jgi:hypothetical protein
MFTLIRVGLSIPQIRVIVAFPSSMVLWSALWVLIGVPVFFFAGVALQYMLSRALEGEGSFLEQVYTNLLFTVPIGIISGVLPIVLVVVAPMTASGLNFTEVLVGVYGIILNVLQIQAVHRMTREKSIAVVFLSIMILVVLAIAFLLPLLLFLSLPRFV